MNQPITVQNLQQFVLNYTASNLERFRRTKHLSQSCLTGRRCVEEISSTNFEKAILNSSYDAVVLYRKSGCVFCEVGARAFLKLSQFFVNTSSFVFKQSRDLHKIRFYTVDAEKNDLPWQFTANKYPLIVFYPAHR